MLAIVEPALSIRGAVQYNEQKLSREQARFLDAHNFLQEKEDLTLKDKLQRFRNLTDLNERSKKKCIHFSVNFPPGDELSDKEMKLIATEFMQAIDFGEQPWLLYRHTDVGHPHMHIVTTNIRHDGSRISNDLRSPHHLKQVCFQIEEKHHLHPVFEMPELFGREQPTPQEERTRYLQKVIYGERPTKTAIEEVLRTINSRYAFTSFEGYNAILSLFNVRADRGSENSPMYENRGLYYRVIDGQGKKLGAPIKASAFDLPVTLEKLEEKFQLSQQKVLERMRYVQSTVNYCLAGQDVNYSLKLLAHELSREKINLVTPALRQPNPRGWQKRVAANLDVSLPNEKKPVIKPDDGHGFFYVDHQNCIVIRDTQLGESCTAAAILRRLGIEKTIRQMLNKNYCELSNAQRSILRPEYPDKAETRRLLLQLSPMHDKVIEKKLELKEQELLALRQTRRLSHRL